MELPIDHFRLLGISPSADAEEVLRFFQLRLHRIPHQGFTPEVIAQRSELLRRSADLLCDNVMRQEYESALLNGAVGLEFSTNREVAGLILLWEGGMPCDAFRLAKRALRPPQAPALGSGRESDLTLLAALSCRDAALNEQELRRYSAAAEILQEGIQLLQRMGKLPEQRTLLERDLEGLLPYRILDLLSRDLSDKNSRQEGLDLLDYFVLKRGGIEGTKIGKSSYELTQNDFEIFFQQIRNFLTVQEQIDLFLAWQKRGSSDAGFLGALSLVASGFYWRKPELLQKARRKINSLSSEEFDQKPLLGSIDLLLGDVRQAMDCFRSTNDKGLIDWLKNYPGEPLAALCDYCRNWLQADVLCGYRDIENNAIDLEAWFGDRDVQDFIEKIERRSAFRFAKAGFSFLSGISYENSVDREIDGGENSSLLENSDSIPLDQSNIESLEEDDQEIDENFQNRFQEILLAYKDSLKAQWTCFNRQKIFSNVRKNKIINAPFIILFLFIFGGSIGFFIVKSKFNQENIEVKIPEKIINNVNNDKEIEEEFLEEVSKEIDNNSLSISDAKFYPLRDDIPSKEKVQLLLEQWLKGKADILAGKDNSRLAVVARPALLKIVQDQRQKDIALGAKQIINAQITSLEILEQTQKRIAVSVQISYRDKRIDSSGKVLSETIIPSLKLKYILGREKKLWQLLDFSSEM